MMRLMLLPLALLASCSGCAQEPGADTTRSAENSWWKWHADKLAVDSAVDEAVNEPDGGDYAKAVAIIRTSDRPQAVKDRQVGLLVIGGFDRKESRRSSETLQQGLELVENSALQPGETRDYVPQQLRLIFERGAGIPPDNIPTDPVIADCWHKLENGGVGDPARCITLRRQRLPHVGR